MVSSMDVNSLFQREMVVIIILEYSDYIDRSMKSHSFSFVLNINLKSILLS